MKVYIVDILPSSLKNKLTKIQEYLTNSIIKYELASEDYGVHYIEGDTIYRIEPNFKPDFSLIKGKSVFENELILDNTNYKMLPVLSQLPVNYILTKMTVYEYQVSKKSKLKLVVECLDEPLQQNVFFQKDKQTVVTNIVPFNFYFVYNETKLDLSDRFIKEEFNVFLSHLN